MFARKLRVRKAPGCVQRDLPPHSAMAMSKAIKVVTTVHPNGLEPLAACLAWLKHREEDMSLDQIVAEGEVHTASGKPAKRKALWHGIQRVDKMKKLRQHTPVDNYKNCGRKEALTEEAKQRIVQFVKEWRNKAFCTCRYIRQELKVKASISTINRVLNDAGYFWKTVPKRQGLTKEQLVKREAWVTQYWTRSSAWWLQHSNMVLDGVTLTMAPRPLNGRQKHAAQRVTSMWMRPGEAFNNDVLTCNRYGVQLGAKVPLWGGFCGNGRFSLRLWTPKPKMSKEEWQALVPKIKDAVDEAYGGDLPPRPLVWHDNERFLLCPEVYKRNGLQLRRFPPNSGDLNPIETVWAWLRRDLGKRELADLKAKRPALTEHQFKQRCAQILLSYETPRQGEEFSPLQKLLRGMPRRLAKCKANRYGRCGK